MYSHDFTRINKDMDVYDRKGDKVGSVGEVYSVTGATASTSSTGSVGSTTSAPDWYLKIDTGFMGLGKNLYIPTSGVLSVEADRVILDADKDTIDSFGWDEKPTFIRD
jgi:hypothetical protein